MPDQQVILWVRDKISAMIPELASSLLLRIGDFKVMRRDLKTRNPGPWEVDDLAKDAAETANVASGKPDLIRQAVEILTRDTRENKADPWGCCQTLTVLVQESAAGVWGLSRDSRDSCCRDGDSLYLRP